MADEKDEKKSKKKPMILVGLLVAGGAYKFVLAPKPAEPADAAEAEVEVVEGEVAPVPELVVNLADTDEVHYARIGVAAVLEEGIAIADVEAELPKISDIVIDIVSSKTFAELREEGATVKLKEEITEATREAFDEERVVRVIFTSFVMQ